MTTVTLGSTGITVPKNGFGALPIQRTGREEAVRLLRRACEGGIRFFDTARAYSDSEEKLGAAFAGMRDKLFIATKAPRFTVEAFWEDLQTSLRLLGTEYVDLYQFHNPDFCPRPGDGTGLYEAMLEAKAQGKVRHIGITNHRLSVAREAIDSGLYETLQFPFSYLATEKELALVQGCKEHNMGFIAMKALAGGTITNSAVAYAYLAQFDNVLPIWGIQRMSELEEFLSYQDNPPALTEAVQVEIEKDRRELAGSFCRGCGYCMPCPQEIIINNCARMSLMIRRAPTESWLGEFWQKEMAKIDSCVHCNQCASKCPYGLDTPALLAENLKDYREVLAGKPL
jgi:aryl-alcohol dehydrogenase-like predicted oxidoreductase